ncbi:hypothetical protein [Natrarchaeobaculum sulfurireducens]|uniref:Uncharacterized protein n=1 Tax=Natrarchaeobaculum sulfurireducens TaxID=2044521 RepID=A0A346PCG8_9EURY|nr:hypothetical protein [Natrarchaeobaculum sulfurireducens]AXR77213.1 hypothetical protein AArc1_0872 [Natrarchaeobaculum sulfurireducens]
MTSARSTPVLGIVLGIVLVAIGIGAYVLSSFASLTALVPAVFGVVIAALGVAARRTERRKLATLGIGVLSLLGVLGSARGIPDVIALLTGGAVDSTVAAVAQGSMILIGLVLVAAAGRDLLG